MKDLNSIVSDNLKRIRKEMRLSLEKLAELTGVSKAMLRQIETGESSPTINTVWKIASGLKIPYTSIINMPLNDTIVVAKADIQPQIEDEGKYRVYSIFPSDNGNGRKFEIYTIEIEEGGLFRSNSHGERTEEFITVNEGTLSLTVGDEEYIVKKGDSITFKADKPHSYGNTASGLTRIGMVIYYSI